MKLYLLNERPSALLAACAPGSALPAPVANVPSAHAHRVGRSGVWGAMSAQEQVQILTDRRRAQVQGTSGFVAQEDVTALKPVGGARGVPPRGRPV